MISTNQTEVSLLFDIGYSYANICRMSAKYMTNMSDTYYVNRISAKCLSNIRQMSEECLSISDNYVRHFLCQPNIRQYPSNVCRISDNCVRQTGTSAIGRKWNFKVKGPFHSRNVLKLLLWVLVYFRQDMALLSFQNFISNFIYPIYL